MKESRKLLCRRLPLFLISTAAVICCTVTADASVLQTFDLSPAFFHYFESVLANKEQRAGLFADSIIRPYPEIYRRPEIFKTDPATLDKYLDEVRAYLPAIRKIHARFIDECEPIEQSFYACFPDFDISKVKVYLMFSLFRFDGKIPHDNPRALFLGLDGLAKFHGINVRLGVILSHELFHLYHFQVNPLPAAIDEIPLYRQVWQEGLATYVSRFLNPNAALADVLLDPQLASEGPKYLPAVARALLQQLESTDDETTARYLSYRRGSGTPSRMGYLIGYDIVAHLAATRSIKELSRLRGQRLLHLIRKEVRALAQEFAERIDRDTETTKKHRQRTGH
jgi:hypothetical protein